MHNMVWLSISVLFVISCTLFICLCFKKKQQNPIADVYFKPLNPEDTKKRWHNNQPKSHATEVYPEDTKTERFPYNQPKSHATEVYPEDTTTDRYPYNQPKSHAPEVYPEDTKTARFPYNRPKSHATEVNPDDTKTVRFPYNQPKSHATEVYPEDTKTERFPYNQPKSHAPKVHPDDTKAVRFPYNQPKLHAPELYPEDTKTVRFPYNQPKSHAPEVYTEDTKTVRFPYNHPKSNVPEVYPDDTKSARSARSPRAATYPEEEMSERKRPKVGKHDSDNSTKERPKRTTYDDTVNYTNERERDAGFEQLNQTQEQLQLQRNLEASKQMLYGVYEHVIAFIEEYEARTNIRTPLPRSNIVLAENQSTKTLKDVESIVKAQLFVFEMHSKSCPKEVREIVNKDLRTKTLEWAAVREKNKMEPGETDVFICQLYEILAYGSTHHTIFDKPREVVSSTTIKETLPHIMFGKHKADELDESFRKDPTKMASCPDTRTADADFAFQLGARRIARECSDLKPQLDADVFRLDKEGIECLN